MLSLRELQYRFANSLRGDETGAIAACIAPGPLSATQRMQIYRNNFRISLRGALAAVYPVVHALVGEGFFAYLAHEFTDRYPSRSGNLHSFGRALPDFLRSFEAAASLPYLPDVAAIEWAWHRAFHAAECPPLDWAALAAVPAEEHAALRFGLHPSVSSFSSPYPAAAIWEAHQSDTVEPVDVAGGGCVGIVQRPADEVQVVLLTGGQFALLSALQCGDGFGEACEKTAKAYPDDDIASAFRQLARLGSLVSFTVPSGTVSSAADRQSVDRQRV
ncbi:MAG: DUF2063 domain-containing protein [Gammaproteobacteria bacterium]|nr:DUF2063 domain-containing protein [Gammaproteobacteria bacterium]